MNKELGDNRMDSDHKFWLAIWLGGGTLTVLLVVSILTFDQIERQSYLDAGLQECKYALVGSAGTATSWLKECPKGGIGPILIEEIVK